jgi:hypothetical protein
MDQVALTDGPGPGPRPWQYPPGAGAVSDRPGTVLAMTDNPAGTVTLTLRIENIYSNGEQVTVLVENLVVPAPDADDRSAWADEHLHPLTGTGQPTAEDAGHIVTIVDSSDPTLVGVVHEFGY